MPATDMSAVMRSLGDPTRRALFERIVEGQDMAVGALVRGGAISQPAVSQHLKALREAGYDKPRIEGLPHCDWVLVDAGDVIVHIFRPEVREFYNIEKMWQADFAGDAH